MEQIILNLVPGGVSPVCYVSQYDVGRKIRLHLRNGSDPYVLSGAETVTATIRKVSGEELIYDIANTSASYVDLIVNYDATDVIGESVCELIITESGIRLGSANFKMRVDPDVYSGDQKLEVVSATSENPNISFETNVEENLLELKAGLAPVQNGTPWIDSNVINKVPYIKRAVAGTATRIGNHLYDKLVGGTVAFNQFVSTQNVSGSQTSANVIFTKNNNGSYTISGTANGRVSTTNVFDRFNVISGHKYFIGVSKPIAPLRLREGNSAFLLVNTSSIMACTTDANAYLFFDSITDISGTSFDISNVFVNVIDLTQMFGSTIADYIYTLESGAAGAGVAWIKSHGFLTKPYYDYNAGELISVKTSAHVTTGFNQWDEEWESGTVGYNTGLNENDPTRIRSKNYIPITPSTKYYFKSPALIGLRFYDANKNFMGTAYNSTRQNSAHTVPAGAYYMRFTVTNTTTYNNDICINLHWDGERDGEYEPYVEHEYPLDSDLELRGIPKLDANNKLYYDGDTYESDGSVTRKYGIVDLGSLSWNYLTSGSNYAPYFSASIVGGKVPSSAYTAQNVLCYKYLTVGRSQGVFVDKTLCFDNDGSNNPQLQIKDSAYIDAATFKTAMSGVYFLYELATPTEETADPFTNPQVCDENGTEEYTDSRAVAIPVGHETYQANICPINGYTEANITRCGKNIFNYDLSDATNLVKYVQIKTGNGTYTMSSDVPLSEGAAVLFFLSGYQTSGGSTAANGVSNGIPRTVTTTDGYVTFAYRYYGTPTVSPADYDIQLEKGSTATAYEPYNGQTYTIAFGQTVYGGVLDVTRGKLHVTHLSIDNLKNETWSYNSALKAFIFYLNGYKTPSSKLDIMNNLCETYQTKNAGAFDNLSDDLFFAVGLPDYYNRRVLFRNLAYTDADTFKATLEGVKLVYELATPFDIDLTPVQISALLGVNNVWHDANGGTEVKFFRMISAS